MKKCSQCGIVKDEREFYKDRSRKDGLQSKCKICGNKHRKKYYQENRDKEIEYTNKYREKHRERYLEYKKKYHQENRDKEIEYLKKYRLEHKDEILEYQQRNKLHGGTLAWNRRYWLVLRSVYHLSKEEWIKMWKKQKRGKCNICGVQTKLVGKGRRSNGKTSCIDHCHKSGQIRAIICHNCNVMIGRAKDDSQILKNAAKYLDYHTKRIAKGVK